MLRWLFSVECSIYLPHTSQQLDETTVAESSANNDVRVLKAAGSQVDAGQDESGQGESAETERSRVGELGGRRLVKTGLEVTTEGRESDRVACIDMGERVATVIVGLALLRARLVGGMVEVVAVTIDARGLHGLLLDLVLFLRARHRCCRYSSRVLNVCVILSGRMQDFQ